MTLEELLVSKFITKEMHDDYVLFAISETGRNWLNRMMHETFMDQPGPNNCKGVAFAHMDGCRQPLRNILSLIDKINMMIKETPNDDRSKSE
jgi:hypothetical protein